MASNKTYIVTKNGEELEQLKTVGDAVKYIESRI